MGDPQDLFQAAWAVMANAYAPYSGLNVGAALRTAGGTIHAGCNVENAAYPEGCCAETSAIAHMIAAGEKDIVEVAVVAELRPGITPCGGCRQRLKEFGTADTLVHLCDASGVVETVTLGALLPLAFDLEAR